MTVHAHRTPDLLGGSARVVSDQDVVDAWVEELVESGHRTLLDRLLSREEVTAAITPVVTAFAAHAQLHELNAALEAARAERYAGLPGTRSAR